MWWQYIIVGLIVGGAFTITIINLVQFFTHPQHKCKGCVSSAGNCSLEDLKREIAGKK